MYSQTLPPQHRDIITYNQIKDLPLRDYFRWRSFRAKQTATGLSALDNVTNTNDRALLAGILLKSRPAPAFPTSSTLV